jgi:hypothetical protein
MEKKPTKRQFKEEMMITRNPSQLNSNLVDETYQSQFIDLFVSKINKRLQNEPEIECSIDKIQPIACQVDEGLFKKFKTKKEYNQKRIAIEAQLLNPENKTFFRKLLSGEMEPVQLASMPNNELLDESEQIKIKRKAAEDSEWIANQDKQSQMYEFNQKRNMNEEKRLVFESRVDEQILEESKNTPPNRSTVIPKSHQRLIKTSSAHDEVLPDRCKKRTSSIKRTKMLNEQHVRLEKANRFRMKTKTNHRYQLKQSQSKMWRMHRNRKVAT